MAPVHYLQIVRGYESFHQTTDPQHMYN